MEKFENVGSVKDVPEVWGLSRDEKAQQHLGKHYEVNARLSWSDSDEPNVDPTIWIHDIFEKGRDNSRMAKAHFLNDYQKRFLMEHCFNIGTPSLGEGKVYLAIEWGPKMPFVNLEFVGAFFRKAEGPIPNKEEAWGDENCPQERELRQGKYTRKGYQRRVH